MSNRFSHVSLIADARSGHLKSVNITLSGTPGTITTVNIPDTARGFRMYPATAIRFAIGENPAAQATQSDATVTEAEMAIGGIAKASAWETRLLESGTGRTLRLRGAAGSEVVDVEFF